MTDPLTGLRSRDNLRAELDAHPSICCFVDVDGLIWLNDQHGHEQGDSALAAIAKYLIASLGERARSIFRVGGEEFLVLLRSNDSFVAREIAAGIVSGVRTLEIPYRRLDRPLRTIVEVNVVILPSQLAASPHFLKAPGDRDWIGAWIYSEKLRTGLDAGVVVDLSIPTSMITVGHLKQVLAHVPDDVAVAMIPSAHPNDSSRLQAASPSYLGGPVFSFRPAQSLSDEFVIVEMVEVTGRGTAILVDALADGKLGQKLTVEITRPDGRVLTARASLELALWRAATPLESFAFLVEARMQEIPSGAKLRVLGAG